MAILLPAYLPPLPAQQWTEEASMAVASQLAHLHAVRWDDAAIRPELRWLRWRRPLSLAICRAHAVSRWSQLAHCESCSGIFTASHLRTVQACLDRAEELAAAMHALPVVLSHGDCHRENLLRTADGQLVWADWQDIHLGRGLMDLVFFGERAFFDGAQLAHDHMLQVYHDQLSKDAGPRVPLATFRRSAACAELLSWLLDWPPFLLQASPDRLACVLERIQVLIDRLDGVA